MLKEPVEDLLAHSQLFVCSAGKMAQNHFLIRLGLISPALPRSSTISAAVGRLVGAYRQHVRSRFSLEEEGKVRDKNDSYSRTDGRIDDGCCYQKGL